jgi:site-specific recombinase XerD
MRSTVARRLSTLCSFYRYCHVEGFLARNPAANVRRPKSTPSPVRSAWTATSSALCWSRPDSGRLAITP